MPTEAASNTLSDSLEQMLAGFGEDSSVAPVLKLLLDEGEYVAPEMDLITVETDHGPNDFGIEKDASPEVRDRIRTHVRRADPRMGACYENALEFWHAVDAVEYVEGYARTTGGVPNHHAWNRVDGHLVDITFGGEEYHGVAVDEETLARVYAVAEKTGVWGVFTNGADDYQYLREHGYVD